MQNFDLNLYKVFCLVADCKSISKAAKVMFVSQQSVSYSIKQLELSLGGKLFFRTPKGVILTPEAENLYKNIKSSFDSINIGERIFTENIQSLNGNIYIGCNASNFNSCLYKYIEKFHKLYPNVKIHIIGKQVLDLVSMLKEHKLDMFIRRFPINSPPETFSFKTFDTVDSCFFCNSKFKYLADKKNVSLEELSNLPLLLSNEFYERQPIEIAFSKNNLKLEPIMNITNNISIIHMVELGMRYRLLSKRNYLQKIKKQ